MQRLRPVRKAQARAAATRAHAIGGELELEVLAYATRTIIVVKRGDRLRTYAPRDFGEPGPSKLPRAVLELAEYYDALLPRAA
jgi:hypothetical protein